MDGGETRLWVAAVRAHVVAAASVDDSGKAGQERATSRKWLRRDGVWVAGLIGADPETYLRWIDELERPGWPRGFKVHLPRSGMNKRRRAPIAAE